MAQDHDFYGTPPSLHVMKPQTWGSFNKSFSNGAFGSEREPLAKAVNYQGWMNPNFAPNTSTFGSIPTGMGGHIPHGGYDDRHKNNFSNLHDTLTARDRYKADMPKNKKHLGHKKTFDQYAGADYNRRKQHHAEITKAYNQTIKHLGHAVRYHEQEERTHRYNKDRTAEAASNAAKQHAQAHIRGLQDELFHHSNNPPAKATYVAPGQQVPKGAVAIGGSPATPKEQGWKKGSFGLPVPKQLTAERAKIGAATVAKTGGQLASAAVKGAGGAVLAGLGQTHAIAHQPDTVLRGK